jgi:ankyrin repeat protein
MWAAGNGHAEVVRLLLRRGADPAQRDNRGFTALSMAQQQGQNLVADLLRVTSVKP